MENLKSIETKASEASLPAVVVSAVADRKFKLSSKAKAAIVGLALASTVLVGCGPFGSKANADATSTPSLLDNGNATSEAAPAASAAGTESNGEGVCKPGTIVTVANGKEGATLRDKPSTDGAALFFMDVNARMKVINCVADLAGGSLKWVNVDTSVETNADKTYQFNTQKTPVPVNSSVARTGFVREDLVEAGQ